MTVLTVMATWRPFVSLLRRKARTNKAQGGGQPTCSDLIAWPSATVASLRSAREQGGRFGIVSRGLRPRWPRFARRVASPRVFFSIPIGSNGLLRCSAKPVPACATRPVLACAAWLATIFDTLALVICTISTK